MTRGPQRGMRRKKSLQDKAYQHHKELFRHCNDVHKTNFFRRYVPAKANGLTIQTKARVYKIDRGASLHMMALPSSNNKDKKTVRRSSKILVIQTANSIVVSDTQATVYIKEDCAFPWVHLVFDSQPVLSLLRPCCELGYHSWTTGGTAHPKVKE